MRALTARALAIAAVACACGSTACGGEPDGGLLEVHASLEQAVAEQVPDYRVYRVLIQGGAQAESREVEQRGAPPDVFVVRSPVTSPPPTEDAFSISVRVQALRFTLAAGEQIVGCDERGDVVLIDGAVNLLDVALAPGDCP